MITERYTIGVDDTDAAGSAGTGALVRALAAHIEAQGWGISHGVTRHQLMRDDRIKHTGHNCAYALIVETSRSVIDLEDDMVDYLRANVAAGSDPGLAILSRHTDLPHIMAFGRRSQLEIMRADWASMFGNEANAAVRGLGRQRRGAVGALAAAGLRAAGNDGVFIDLRGIRDIAGRVTAGHLREHTAIDEIIYEDGEEMDRDDRIESFDWIRPTHENGKAVLRCFRSTEERRLWLPQLRLSEGDPDA